MLCHESKCPPPDSRETFRDENLNDKRIENDTPKGFLQIWLCQTESLQMDEMEERKIEAEYELLYLKEALSHDMRSGWGGRSSAR